MGEGNGSCSGEPRKQPDASSTPSSVQREEGVYTHSRPQGTGKILLQLRKRNGKGTKVFLEDGRNMGGT